MVTETPEPDRHAPVAVTLLDTATGRTVTTPAEFGAWWWVEGNGSCDCNRSLQFMTWEEQEAWVEAEGLEYGVCVGARRFLVVAAPTDYYRLWEYNADYPPALVAAHLPAPAG